MKRRALLAVGAVLVLLGGFAEWAYQRDFADWEDWVFIACTLLGGQLLLVLSLERWEALFTRRLRPASDWPDDQQDTRS